MGLYVNIYAQDLSFIAGVARNINIRQSVSGAGVDLSIAAAAAATGSAAAGGNLNLAGGAGDGAGAPGNVLATANSTTTQRGLWSLRNTTAATTGQQQWAPGWESIGHGWTYQTFSGSSLSRSGSSTVTVTTTASHGLSNGATVYVIGGSGSGSTSFATGAFVIGGVTSTTFTYTDASDTTHTGTLTTTVYDSTGGDNAVKVTAQMRPVIGRRYQDITSDHGMASPEMVFFRSSYPNNGAYAEWFKFSATVNSTGYPLITTGGVTFQTMKSDGVTPGSYLALAPGTVVLQDDNSVGFQTFPASSYSNFNAIGVANWNAALVPSLDSRIGLALGLPGHSWFDIFDVKASGQFIGVGDPAAAGWYNAQGVYGQLGGVGWDSTLLPSSLAALSVFGGQSRFRALANMGALTVTPTGGATGNYTYFVVASDRNGFTTLAGTGSTTTGPATLDATHYNTITWTAIAGAVQYDVYLLAIGQAGYIGTTLTASFKDTGAARYVSGVNGASGSGTLIDVPKNPSSSGGSGGGSSTYYVYAMDFDGHLGAVSASTTIAQTPSVASPISLAWSPIGGAFGYLICRGANTAPIGFAYTLGGNIPTITQGTGGGNLSKSGSTTVTATMSSGSQAGGHGFRVGDTFTVVHTGTADANFIGGTFTVASVTAYNVFTYVETGGTSVTATAAAGVIMTYTGASQVVSPAFSDFGYAPRTIGSATRNNTGDILTDGFVQYSGPVAALPVSPWINVSGGVGFSNGWVDQGSPTTAYYKDALGMVHVRILVKSGTNGTSIFTLPVGYRPAAGALEFYADIEPLQVGAISVLLFNANGTVVPNGTSGTTFTAIGEAIFTAGG